MKVLVIGATGETGRLIIEECLHHGYEVTAFARTANKLKYFNNINIIQGNVLDIRSLENAVEGQDIVICALGVPMGEKIDNSRSQGTKNLVKAMALANVSRLIAISTIGVGNSRKNMSFVSKLLYPVFVGKARLYEAQKQEDAIINSDLQWTLVRPPRLVNTKNKVSIEVGDNIVTNFTDTLQRCSLAGLVVELSKKEPYINKAITVIGI